MRKIWLGGIAAALLSVCAALRGAAAGDPLVLREWRFERAADVALWEANGHLKTEPCEGAWKLRAQGHDPMLVLKAPLDVPAAPRQCLELRIRADRPGAGEFFWTNTTQGKFGGFTQEKTTDFFLAGAAWETVRLFPFWHSERKIVRLRLDLYDGATFEIAAIRIVELPATPVSGAPEFDFSGSAAPGWVLSDGTPAPAADGAMKIRTSRPDGFALGPPVAIDPLKFPFASLRAASDVQGRAAFLFATDSTPGLHAVEFAVEPGSEHTHVLDLLETVAWHGRIVAIGLRPPKGGTLRVSRFEVAGEPRGPAELRVARFALADPLPRAGRPARLEIAIENKGGRPAAALSADITLPAGVTFAGPPPAPPAEPLPFGARAAFGCAIQAAKPVEGEAILRVAAPGASPASAKTRLAFHAVPDVPASDYVPEPAPVRGDTEVGVYYFPGWHTRARWAPIEDFPERKPVLGWYREGDPEVADWHIKWAVEHGITFFVYDWYWVRGARHLEHGLHDGYFKARYRNMLKFCLLWANHNPKGTSSLDDCAAVARYWIENYFRRPEHFTLNGRPLLIMFSPDRLRQDLGAAARQGLDIMREECRKAGIPPVHLAACVPNASAARLALEDGYDSVTCYNWSRLGMEPHEMQAPYGTLIDGYRENWQEIFASAQIPLLLPLSGGWDSRPWHGDAKTVRFGRTPALFKKHLVDARDFLDARKGDARAPRAIIVEAWNEWGEGSYIEPHQEFAFGYLDAIRDVFAKGGPHADLGPADTGRGPYDLPADDLARTSWDFQDDTGGWDASMQIKDLRLDNGALTALTAGSDPALSGPSMDVPAASFRAVLIRLKTAPPGAAPPSDRAQLFWRTGNLKESEATQISFDVVADAQWHEYRVDVSANPRWRGRIRHLRLDPSMRPGVRFAIDSIRLEP